jgi:DNA mismatch repair protein MutS2
VQRTCYHGRTNPSGAGVPQYHTDAHRALCLIAGQGPREALSPSTDLRRARAALSETSEAAALVREWSYFPFGGLSDISELLARARTGLFLEGAALLRVADCLRAAVAVHRYLERGQDLGPTLWHLGEHLTLASELQRDIEKALDDEGR